MNGFWLVGFVSVCMSVCELTTKSYLQTKSERKRLNGKHNFIDTLNSIGVASFHLVAKPWSVTRSSWNKKELNRKRLYDRFSILIQSNTQIYVSFLPIVRKVRTVCEWVCVSVDCIEKIGNWIWLGRYEAGDNGLTPRSLFFSFFFYSVHNWSHFNAVAMADSRFYRQWVWRCAAADNISIAFRSSYSTKRQFVRQL